MTWLNGLTDVIDMSLSKLWELVMDKEAWYTEVPWVTKSRTRLSDWNDWTDWTESFTVAAACFMVQKLLSILVSPLLFGTVPQNRLRSSLPSLSFQKLHWIKWNSLISGCTSFFLVDSIFSYKISQIKVGFLYILQGRSPGGGQGNPLQYSCLENPMDRQAWWAKVHTVADSWTWMKWLCMHNLYFLRLCSPGFTS